MQQNVHKKRKKTERKRGKRKEIVTTLGSRGVGDERGNPPVMGARATWLFAVVSFIVYISVHSHAS